MKDKKKALISDRPKSESLIHVRVTKAELEMIQKAADAYAAGNRSQWMRYAAIHFKPSPKDLKE